MPSQAPSVTAVAAQVMPFVTALIAAAVALTVAVFTQLVLSRRETTKLLTQKLEDLYLCTVKWQKDSDDLKTQLEWFLREGKIYTDELRKLVEKQSSHESVEKITMYVELYFPPLRRFSRECWEANRTYEVLFRKLQQEGKLELEDIRRAAMRVQLVLAKIRSEIPLNRECLTRSRLIAPRYKEVEVGDERADA
jgi:hypothetical protein